MIATVSRLRPATKVGVVAAGYVVAFLVAALVLSVYVAATNTPDRQTSSGMFAFGDSLVFLAALGIAAVPATAAALFFLRSRPSFWVVLSVGAVIVACTALVAVALTLASTSAGVSARVQSWSVVAPLRILIAPLLALFFLLSGVFAPNRPARISLLGASVIEVVSFVTVAFRWWSSTR